MSNPLRTSFTCVTFCALLTACGGGADPDAIPAGTLEFVGQVKAQALSARPAATAAATALTTTNATVTADMVLDWAEFKFADLFPKANAQSFPSVVYDGVTYNARAYSGAWGIRYLGITPDGRIFGLGDFTNNALQGFDTVATWADQVTADRCAVYVSSCAGSNELRLSASNFNSMTLQSNGDVWVWGSNAFGQWGGGSPISGTSARRLAVDAVAVGAGYPSMLAVRRDGRVLGWGTNLSGEIGDYGVGTPEMVPAPRVIDGLENVALAVASVSASQGMTTAVKADGTVWHVPGTVSFQFATFRTSVTPRQVPGLQDVTSIVSGGNAAFGMPRVFALQRNGSVWEINFSVVRGANTTYNATAFQVLGLPPTQSAACSSDHCLFLLQDGRVFALGKNNAGQLGNGSAIDSLSSPIQVSGLASIRSVAALPSTSVAVGNDGRLWTWGDSARVGRETNGQDSLTPAPVPDVNNAVEVSAGPYHVLFRRSDGSVWGWGNNGSGELGDGTSSSSRTPVRALGIFLN